jgi:CubicO group peptidase (beta-lactamase class C family)
MAEPCRLLERAVADGVFPGAVLRVEALGATGALLQHSAGRVSSDPPGVAVSLDTIFDLASLTKLYTATAALRLVADGCLQLDDRLDDLLGEAGGHLAGVTVAQLLEHRSGLPAWRPYYEGDDVRAAALAEPLQRAPGEAHEYSDVGFLVLMEVLERVSSVSLRLLITREVLAPLGLMDTGFRPVSRGEASGLELLATGQVAATERCPYRSLLVGEVHDDNAWAMGGVAPHAGLFATAEQVAAFARGWWDAPQIGYLPAQLRDAAWAAPQPGGTHGLGWDSVSEEHSSAGSILSSRSHGHLGFTGTSLWIDPEREVAVVLLTNRVHPSRDGGQGIREFRPLLHDAVANFVDRVQ